MENEKPKKENDLQKKSVKELEYRIVELTGSVEALASELETIKLNVQKRKSENTTLKILFYTGLIVLLLGFLYTNSTLQRAQMESLESSIHTLQTLMNRKIFTVQNNLSAQVEQLNKDITGLSGVSVRGTLEGLDLVLSQLDPGDEKTARLIEQVKNDAHGLLQAYADDRNALKDPAQKPAENRGDSEDRDLELKN